jgi:hypothetical protein
MIDEGAPMIIPFALFFVALAMMLYARLFTDNYQVRPALNDSAGRTTALGGNPTKASLPSPSISTMGNQQVRTNELAQPASVTEHTTRLLDE